MSLQETITLALPRLPGYRAWRPRRCHVFAVGSPKTGTHSLAALFARHYRSAHEAEAEAHVALLARRRAGEISDDAVKRWLADRDYRLWLDMDAAHINGEFAPELCELFPAARFVLTMREPVAWVDSAMNQHLGRRPKPHWVLLRDLMYGPRPASYPPEEQLLLQQGVYPLDRYLAAWARRYRDVVAAVPRDRLLILRIDEIIARLPELADFCGVPRQHLATNSAHQFPARNRFGLVGQLAPDYVRARVHHHAGDIVSTLFPDSPALPGRPPAA
jgi:hypothetical protein